MTSDQINTYRTELLSLAASLDRSLAQDRREVRREDEPDVAGGPIPSTDDMPNAGADEVEAGLIMSEERLLAEVTAALDRIDSGTFGVCTDCGRRIGKDRLDALPYARQCIRCAQVARAVAD